MFNIKINSIISIKYSNKSLVYSIICDFNFIMVIAVFPVKNFIKNYLTVELSCSRTELECDQIFNKNPYEQLERRCWIFQLCGALS